MKNKALYLLLLCALPLSFYAGQRLSAKNTALRDCGDNPNDVMVPVGSWCIDKYEASVWSSAQGEGSAYFTDSNLSADAQQIMPVGEKNYPAGCRRDGAGCTQVALSKPDAIPARGMTWYQAAVFCANSGKTLVPDGVWQLAATGTMDPGSESGSGGTSGGSPKDGAQARCNINTHSKDWSTWLKPESGVRPTARAGSTAGSAQACISMFGVEDMVGNVWEWTGTNGIPSGMDLEKFSQGKYVKDGSPFATRAANWNINGSAFGCDGDGTEMGKCDWKNNIPAAILRGGYWDNPEDAGVAALWLHSSGATSRWCLGFRCARPR